ncbi:MAG: hypothetical protein U0641_15150 [Anaerolineae bacterium]
MELLIPVAMGGLLLMVALMFALSAARTGNLTWNAQISRNVKALWGTVFIVAVVVIFVVFGPAAMLVGWPFFVVAPTIAYGCFWLMDLLFSRKPSATTAAAPVQPPALSWDEMWRSYEGRPLPGWMLEAASSGRVVYDGHPANVVDGRLVPVQAAQTGGLDGLFARLDRLLGPGPK